MSTDLKSAANGRIRNPSAPSAAIVDVAAEGRYPTPPSITSSELLNRRDVCAYFGGINPSTLYRGIKAGRFPRPVRIGGSSRWLRQECEAVLRGLIDGRGR